MYGARSLEHEISVITALQAMAALDPCAYDVVPVYLHPDGRWYTGEPLRNRAVYRRFDPYREGVSEVTLLPDPNVGGLTVFDKGRFVRTIPIDVYLLAFHGRHGEDGAVQGLLELANAAYTSCGVFGSALAMNKAASKGLAAQGHILD